MMKHNKKGIFFITLMLFVYGCMIPKQAKNIENACAILDTHKRWRQAFVDAHRQYGVPPHVIMAIIYQESRFVHDARPPRKKVLGVPTFRPSDAYGYPQALNSTWDWYIDKTGSRGADRDHFPDAVDFVAWYVSVTHVRTGISKWDTKNQYLAYHEGAGGYLKGTYRNKAWLIQVANKVEKNSQRYRSQLSQCYQY